MDFLKVSTAAQAQKAVENWCENYPRAVLRLPTCKAVGHRAASDVYSPENLPEYDRSTVDGYAVKASSTFCASESSPSIYSLVGEVKIGVLPDFELSDGQTAYVPTGGAVPKGADCVAMIEYSQTLGGEIEILRPESVRENVITVGEDVRKGERIIRAGEKLTALNLGVLAALGIDEIDTVKPLKVAIVSTGDELVEIDNKTQIGQIRDTNTTINRELCKKSGFDVVSTELVADDYDLLSAAFDRALEAADIVLTSGGSSKGNKDYTARLLREKGRLLVEGIALRPGKPTSIAISDGKLIVGLPGHPMACLLTLKLIVLDTLERALGGIDLPFLRASAAINFPSSPGRLTVQPVKLCYGEEITAEPIFYKSGSVSVLSRADGYILIPENAEGVYKGQTLKVFLI